MIFAIKSETGLYYCGAGNNGTGKWDKQLRKATFYTQWKMAVKMRDNPQFAEYSPHIVSVDIIERGTYNPDWEL